MSSASVRHLLGTPSDVRTYAFFSIKLDQLIFRHPSEPDVSVFFVADRVVAEQAGGDVPVDIFRVLLPSPRDATSEEEDEGFVLVGMNASDVKARYGAMFLDVNYTFNDQPAEAFGGTIYRIYIRGRRPHRVCRFGAIADRFSIPRPLSYSTIAASRFAFNALREHRNPGFPRTDAEMLSGVELRAAATTNIIWATGRYVRDPPRGADVP
jgi:hypothetical protein